MKRLLLVSFIAFSALGSCARTELAGPPNLRLGRDECAECGMIINEDRCSSGMLINREGVKEHALFDDVGCMLDWAHERPERVVRAFVHDHATRDWVPAEQATYVLADETKLPTPMGSGIAAFGTTSSAELTAREHAGEVLDYASLVRARREWMEARYGRPDRAPVDSTVTQSNGGSK
jgi:nitrous oxide reductase accessory protein NosL